MARSRIYLSLTLLAACAVDERNPYERTVTPEMFGAVGDCTTDDYSAFKSALSYLNAYSKANGGRLRLARKCYYLGRTLEITRPVHIEGELGGGNAATQLKFPQDTKGVYFGGLLVSGQNSQWSTISNVFLQGSTSGTGTADKHGIQADFQVHIGPDVYIDGFNGNGIHLSCDINRTPATNCNSAFVERIGMSNMTGWCTYIDGGDSNAHKFDHVECTAIGAGCIYSDSFLGCTFDSMLCEDGAPGNCGDDDPETTCGVYLDNVADQSIFQGLYLEAPIPFHSDGTKVKVWGALGEGQISGKALYDRSNTVIQGVQSYYAENDNTKVTLGHAASTSPLMLSIDTYDGTNPHFAAMHFEANGSAAFKGMYCWHMQNSNDLGVWCMMTNTSSQADAAYQSGNMWIRQPLWLGGSSNTGGKIQQNTCTTAPTRTDLPTGSICWNASTSADVGWRYNGTSWGAF